MSQKKLLPYRLLVLNLLVFYELVAVPVEAVTCSQMCHYVPWARDADCSSRHLHQIPQECVGSKVLNLNRNNITEVPSRVFSSFAHLKYLQILGNNVQLVQANSFAGAMRLKSINLLFNVIRILHAHSFNDTISLKWVYLTGNQIVTIEPGVFQEAPQIEMLYLDDNKLGNLDEGVFQGLSKVQRLLLGGNMLRELSGDIFRDLTVLNYLDLSRNQLRSLSRDTFRELMHLNTINLADNGLTNIAPGSLSFSGVTNLDISNNGLTTLALDPKELAFVETVKASGNPWNCDCALDPFRKVLLSVSDSEVHCEQPSSRANTSIISYTNLCFYPTPRTPDLLKTPKKSFQKAGHDTDHVEEEYVSIANGYSPEIITLIVVSSISFVAVIAIGMFLVVFVVRPWFRRVHRKEEDASKKKKPIPEYV